MTCSAQLSTTKKNRPGGRLVVSNPHPFATGLLDWRATVADDAGAFRFEALPPGDYLLEASSPRLGAAVDRVRVAAGATAEVVAVVTVVVAQPEEPDQPHDEQSDVEDAEADHEDPPLGGHDVDASAVGRPREELSRLLGRGLAGDLRVRHVGGGVEKPRSAVRAAEHIDRAELPESELPQAARRIAVLSYHPVHAPYSGFGVTSAGRLWPRLGRPSFSR